MRYFYWVYLYLGCCLSVYTSPLQAAITLVDDAKTIHTFAAPVKRIISLAPHITELLFAVGAGAQIVGTLAHSDYPKAARKIPRIGDYYQVNMEKLVTLKPDIIIGWQANNARGNWQKIHRLKRPIFISNPKTFVDIARNLQQLGILTGHSQQGERAAHMLRHNVQNLRQRHQHKKKIRVFYQVWDTPLMTLNRNSFITHVIELCGGVNVFADLPTVSSQVSLESVIAAKPEVILISEQRTKAYTELKRWQEVKGMHAVQVGNVYPIDASALSRPTPRLYQGAHQLCQVLDKARQKLVHKN